MEPVQEEANRTAKEIEHDRPAADHLVVVRAGEEAAFSWQLHLRNQADDVVRVLRSDPNEQMLRLVATLVTKRTGWPLREASGGE